MSFRLTTGLSQNTRVCPTVIHIHCSMRFPHCLLASTIPYGSFVSFQSRPSFSRKFCGYRTYISDLIYPLCNHASLTSATRTLSSKQGETHNCILVKIMSAFEQSFRTSSFKSSRLPCMRSLAFNFLCCSSSSFTLNTVCEEITFASTGDS